MRAIRQCPRPENQRGAALITSLVLLLVMTVLATTTMRSATLEQRMAANAAIRQQAFQAAESALVEAFQSSRGVYASSMLSSAGASGVTVATTAPGGNDDLDGSATIHHIELEGTPACGESSMGVGTGGFALRYFEIDASGSVTSDGSDLARSDVTAGVTICGPS